MKLELKRTDVRGEFKLFINGEELPCQYPVKITTPVDQIQSVAVRFRSIPGDHNTVQIIDYPDVSIDIDETQVDYDPGSDAGDVHIEHGHAHLCCEGDEYVCYKCGKRWNFDDTDVPGCV